jgi:putative MFS transporter
LGGLFCQALGVLALVPALWLASIFIALTTGISMLLIASFGQETRGRDLRELEVPERP